MAAGLGFKTFTTGEVLTAADVNGYLMQGVLVFDDATARDAAITAPVEGQFAYLKDTNVTTYYTGSAWANLDTTGMTNPMTTTADMIYSSSGSTPARLGIGTAGQVLTVNGGATAPEWAAPAGGITSANAVVNTFQTTTSVTYTDLTTVGPAVTLTTGTKALVILTTWLNNQGTSNEAAVSYAVSGATTTAASDDRRIYIINTGNRTVIQVSAVYQATVTAGSNTFTMKYRVNGSTGEFERRGITVIDLGS
jgi:hypothetical protein